MIDWRPIETAPKDGTTVLLWCVFDRRLGFAPCVTNGQLHDGQFYIENDGFGITPTHWAPLNPPEGA